MRSIKSVLILLVLVLPLISSTTKPLKSYKDHKVVSFRIENAEQLKEIKLLERERGFIFMDPPTHIATNIELILRAEHFPMFKEIALSTKIDFKVSTDDMQSWLDAEKPLKQRKAFSLEQYNVLEDIYQFLDEMSQTYPGKVTVYNIGESFEGRTMKAIKIETSANNPGIFIESNIHAREWISSATSLWLINEILTLTDPELRAIVDSITWYFVPVTNPDGYVYTHEVDRLWRKTRSNHNILCPGTDPNRNFGYNFRQGGSATVPCTSTYSGPYAFSEKEASALMDFYGTVAYKTDLYLCFHSAAKMIIYPLGHTLSTDLVPNVEHLREIVQTAAEALAVRNGTIYQYGNGMQILYQTSGSSRDHAYGHFKTPLVFTYEMRPGDESVSRFILPPEEIEPNSEEIFDSLIAMIQKSKELGYFQLKN